MELEGPDDGSDAGAPARAAPAAEVPRRLRRDAERNRQRILKAAAEVFNDRGLEASLDEVARHAGVGVGTVYRRFPSKEDLVEALFGRDGVAYARRRNAPLVGRLVERAQAAGQLRLDLKQTDIPFILFTLTEATQFAARSARDLAQVPQPGFGRPAASARGRHSAPGAAMLPEEMEQTMRQHAPRHPGTRK